MGSLNPFKKPKMPKIQTAPPVPNAAAVDTAKAEGDILEKLRKQRGRAATILSGGGGEGGGLATKTLLGGEY